MKSDIRLAVLGDPVRHSLSPAMHMAALRECGLDGTYEKLHVRADDLAATVARLGGDDFTGFNVTVPHKERVVRMLSQTDGAAERIGAVNTVVVRTDGLHGYNTDATGFARLLPDIQARGCAALVVGAGGAARACVDTLVGRGWSVTVAARRFEQAHHAFGSRVAVVNLTWESEFQSVLNASKLLVNASSAGMNQAQDSPLPKGITVPSDLCVIDLVYAPLETMLLRQARDAGCLTIDGLALLASQAADSFALWTGRRLPDAFFRQAAEAALSGTDESDDHNGHGYRASRVAGAAGREQSTSCSETKPV